MTARPGTLPVRTAEQLRRRVFRSLRSQGFRVKDQKIEAPDGDRKDALRNLHAAARQEKAIRELKAIGKREPELLASFAQASDMRPEEIDPQVTIVETGSSDAWLYRYASLLWSVPVSQGFGRRTRFLVRDRANGKLIGVFAAGDPVFNLRCRDQLIGWNSKARENRLYNVLDLFVLGSVPPYNQLLGGKLVAYLAASNEVRRSLERKYAEGTTVIRKEHKDARIALLTTSSALGKSALYDRIGFAGKPLYQRIGATQGWGHFHLNHGLFEELAAFVERAEPGKAHLHRFGQGPNWKLRTARHALTRLGLSPDLMRHGIGREVYTVNVAHNASAFLRGEADKVHGRDLPRRELVEHWKQRWLAGRVERGQVLPADVRKDVATSVRAGLPIKLPPRQAVLSR